MATLNLENTDLNHRKMGGWLTTVKLQFPALKVCFNPVSHQHHFLNNGRYTKSLRTFRIPFSLCQHGLVPCEGCADRQHDFEQQ